MNNNTLNQLTKEQLIDLCEIYAKNWLAMDGVWFQSVEEKFGICEALEHDANAWKRYTVIEAQRIKQFLNLPERAGIEGLRKALLTRFYGLLNQNEISIENDHTLIYRVVTCRVQEARERKKMTYHPCKPVAMIEYSYFASTIDERFKTEVISCHPDVTDPTCNCSWRFTLKE